MSSIILPTNNCIYRTVVFDPGSSDMLIPSTGCNVTGCSKLPHRFDPKRSTTFKDLRGPFYISFTTGTDAAASGNFMMEGTVARDAVSVAGLDVSDFQFGLVTNQSDVFAVDPFDGIVGLGFTQALSTGSQTFLGALNSTGHLEQYLYGLYLTPHSLGNAEISIGRVDNSKFNGAINYIPVNPVKGQFNGTFEKVFADGKLLDIEPNSVIFDSGTATLVAPKDDAEKIYASISPSIKALDDSGTYGIPCAELADLKKTVSFMIGGHNYTIPAQELSIGPLASKPGMCQTFINASFASKAGDKALWIIGSSLLKYYYTVWDVGNTRFGLAATAHSPSAI